MTNGTQLDKKAELIRRLLAKAESTTPAEAEALTEHAERLMLRYGLDRAQLAGQDVDESAMMREGLARTGQWAKLVALREGRLVEALGLCSAFVQVRSTTRSEVVLVVVGVRHDVEHMRDLLRSLANQRDAALSAWWESYEPRTRLGPTARRLERREFVDGFYRGAEEKARRARRAEVTARHDELVLVNRRADRTRYIREEFGPLRHTRAPLRSHGGVDAEEAGIEAGRRATLGAGIGGAGPSELR